LLKLNLMRDNQKFLLVFFLTLILMVLVIIYGGKKSAYAGSGVKVDWKKIEKMVQEKRLSLHPAQFYKKLSSLEEAE